MDFEAEHEKLKTEHLKYYNKMSENAEKIIELEQVIDELEMKCYREENTDCLAHHEIYLIGTLETNRKLDVQRYYKGMECYTQIPYAFRPQNEYEWQINSVEALQAYKNFIECSQPYDEIMSIHYDEKYELYIDGLRRLKEFNKDS